MMNIKQMMIAVGGWALTVLMAMGSMASAHAATSSAPLNASMRILAACRVVSASNVDFGAYTGAAAVDRTMSVVARCNKGSTSGNIFIKMDCGLSGAVSGSVCNRNMKNVDPAFASSLLGYKVYTNTGYTTELTNSGVSFPSTTANGYEFSLTLYPRLPASQYTAAYGNYSDDVNVSIVF